jgi:hypothetical protein
MTIDPVGPFDRLVGADRGKVQVDWRTSHLAPCSGRFDWRKSARFY